ncbi:adenine nucleotide alpha hydrolase [Lysobacter sp. A6]|uniref:Adenine nucleotide alpha hydrolase n=1 Tax=Noviluteimonas lactosilytica TaxID=2888523 RepID=A0ABS8JLB0_9GAMM|nr:adenine nucleotide alpha hydrolase [Lysobacter lactosilyticus]MCC8364228.1 adenine nucleotide alpha hydrolase [Lysobacter lactosilyticus]
MRRQMVLSWSGGKDAAWTLHRLRATGEADVVGLVTTVTSGYERIAMHGIRRDLLQVQARATGLPVIEAVIPPQCDNATYEASFAQALQDARTRWPACETIAFGDLFLADVKAWREALCARLGWTPHFPLFGSDTAALAREMLAGGLCAQLCVVDTQQLDASFSGRAFDAALLADLPASCDPCGENGEFHTLVHDGPMFDHPIAIERGERVLRDERFAYTDFSVAA